MPTVRPGDVESFTRSFEGYGLPALLHPGRPQRQRGGDEHVGVDHRASSELGETSGWRRKASRKLFFLRARIGGQKVDLDAAPINKRKRSAVI